MGPSTDQNLGGSVLETIFKDLPDDQTLGALALEDQALGRLVEFYNTTQEVGELPKADLDLKLGDFKSLLIKLPESLQLRMLNEYKTNGSQEPEAVREDRKLKHWVVRTVVLVFAAVALIIVGAITAIGVRTGDFTQGPVVDSIINAAITILKLVFATPS